MDYEGYKKQRMFSPEMLRLILAKKLYTIMDVNYSGDSDKAYEMLCSIFGHSEKHIAQTDEQMLKRLIDEGKVTSSFMSKYDYVDFTINALLRKRNEICHWVQRDSFENESWYKNNSADYNKNSGNLQRYNAKNAHKRLALEVDMREPIGCGWIMENGQYQKKEARTIRILIERDSSRDSEFPFYPVTVYADIAREDAKNIGEPVNPYDLAYDKNIQYEGKLERCLARYRCDVPKGYEATYIPENGDNPERLKITGRGINMIIRDREDHLEIRSKSYRGNYGKLYMNDVERRHPDLAFFVKEIENAHEKIRTGGLLPDRRKTEEHVRDMQSRMKIDVSYEPGDSNRGIGLDTMDNHPDRLPDGEMPNSLKKTGGEYRLSDNLDSLLKDLDKKHGSTEHSEPSKTPNREENSPDKR